MIARIKGLKISQASERTAVTGQEMIPFQDGERNGKIRMIEFKDMTMYIFDPTIVDGKVSQEDYDALKQAIEEGKLIYTINSNRNGLDLATEVAIVGGTIYIESPDFIKEEGTDNISQVVFDTITVDGSLNYSKEQYTTTVIKTTGDGTKVLTDNGQYVYIGNLALTNIKFKDGTNTSTYDLVTNGITFRQNSTPCVSWNTVKSGNNIYMDIRIANATASMDGLMSKEDYVELNTTIPGQIEDLKEADSNINNRIDDLDDKIDKEIADREAEIDRIENKFDGVTDKLEEALQKEIEDRKAGDTTITNSLNAFISTKGQPGGLAELDSTGKVPAAQLPSYVDDVLEFSTKAQFPQTGETGKIYVAKDTNLTYRWTGTQYLEISQSLALGETPSTAYPGDKGKANRDALNSMPTKLTSYLTPTTSTGELVKINYKYAAKDGLNYGPLQDDNIDIPSATTTNAGAMSAIDKGRLDDLYNEFGSIQNPGDKLDSLPNNLVTGVDATSRNATSVTINYKQSDLSAASNSYANPITKSQTIPAATQSAAGVMTATDKQNLDVNIPNRITNLDNRVTTEVDRLEELIESSSSEITNDLNVEIQARKDGDNQLQTNINNLQSTMNTELAKKVGKVTVAGSGKTLTVNVSQAAYSATVEWRYKFGFSNGARDNISIAIRNMKEYDGASVTFASYKSKYVDGVEDVSSRQYVDFSIGDYASWATVTKVSSSIANEGKFRFTLSSNFNNKSNRQTFVTVTQNESNKSIICDIMQVGSDAFVATYYSHVRGSDTYPDEISFGLVTTPTTKQYEWESTFEVHTVDSDYDAYTYNYGAIIEVKRVTANASMTTTWFGYEYIQNGGSYQYDLLKVNAPESDGINHSEKLYILQLVTSAPSTSYNYREITNTPILAEILVTQRGNTIS